METTRRGRLPHVLDKIPYGLASRKIPLFQLRQVVASRDRPLKISRLVISAPSAAAADAAYEFAVRANPDVQEAYPRHFAEGYASATGSSAQRTRTSSGGTRVSITDFDGNMVDILYYQPPPEYDENHTGMTVRRTLSTKDEVNRILCWNYDVGSETLPPPSSSSSVSARTATRRSYARHPEDDRQPGLRRSVTGGTSSSVYEPAASARENSNGLSAGAVAGALLGVAGVAAAAGWAYNNMGRDKNRSRQEYDMPPSFTRRSTYPERHEGYSDREYSDRKARYVDVEHGIDRVRSKADYTPSSNYQRPPPDYIASYTTIDPSPRSSA
ncbi:hypothetical protein N0V88_006101 [Collariella sp. IMI 366227]|nr:hypothetical protein N0V88_006101 [Collariella sp. IMI 366227]